jgi:DNA-binding transcriptional ArsR family regulator
LGNTDSEILALRALAHPLRLRLLELAAAEGSVTTSLASERTGESSANCSFHLRLLARHGFLVGAAGARDRRERPWRLADRTPLADLWSRLAATPRDDGWAELMRRQLRIFDPDELELAA